MATNFNILDFHDPERSGNDMTPAVQAALEKARGVRGAVLQLPAGEYHFWPEHAPERTYYVSNNDHGTRRILFPLVGCRDITVDGGGSTFILHGRLSPFVIDGSEQVTVRNLTLDCARPFFTQGVIGESTTGYVDVKIDRDAFPYRIENGELVLCAKEWDVEDDTVLLLTEFDPKTRAPSYDVRFYLGKFRRNQKLYNDKMLDEGCCVIHAEERPEGILRIFGSFGTPFRPGYVLTITHEKRMNSGFFITDSRDTVIEHINFFQMGAMGVIAQVSENIALRNIRMVPRPGTDWLVSINADATHFVNCSGRVSLEDCVLENMLDDAGNFHGIYTTVSRQINACTLEVELMHFQQHGINVYRAGDRVAFLHRRMMDTYHTAVVKAATLTDPRHIRLELESPVDGIVTVGDAVENPSRMPELHIRNCRTGNNRPRGFLIGTPRRAVIEDCVFYNCALGIHVPGDANGWFESGGVADLTIRGNTFKDCGYAWSHPPVLISPEIPDATDANTPCYHRNIRVIDNLFETFDVPLMSARSVDGLVFKGNRRRPTTSYPPRPAGRQAIELKDCRNADVETATQM